MRNSRWCALAAVCLIATGCSSGGDSGPASSAAGSTTTAPATTTTVATSTTIADTTTTAASSTTVASTTTTNGSVDSSTSTTVACDFVGGVDEQRFDFPQLMTSEIGADIRTGVHECYERIVIELQAGFAPTPAGMPGWLVRYADGPVTLGQTDDQFIELDGDADLLITMNAWMQTFDADGVIQGYVGPTDIHPTNTHAIRQLVMVDNFEGQHTWAVGLDQQRAFRVFALTGPDRLVIDIAT